MKFRLISKNGDALGLAHRIDQEGHKVDYWVKIAKAKAGYKGILPQKEHWNTRFTPETVVLFDMVGSGSMAENLRKNDFPAYGGGKLNDVLELDRQFGLKLAKMSGLNVPKFQQFKSFAKAIDFVGESDKAWVFKPQNNQSPAYTYVSIDKEDMVEMLGYFKNIWQGKVDFILEEKIDGIEVSVEVWYMDGEAVPGSLNSTVELKRFMDGGVGPNTGCMGSIVRFWRKADPKIYKTTLKKVESFLRRFKYNGPLDCNCIISEKDKLPYFLEWTARIGYNAVYALSEGLNQPWGAFISDLAHGDLPKLKPSYDWLGAVRVSVPPYPNETGAEKSANKPIRGELGDLEHIWLLDAKYEKDQLLTAGVDGVVCEVTGKNKNLEGLGHDIYARIEKLKIPDKQYRTDIITEGSRRIKKLQEWRYL